MRVLKTLLAMLALVIAIIPDDGFAQTPKVARVGFLVGGTPGPTFDQFRQGLSQLGYVEGKNLVIEARFAQGNAERLPELAAELVRLEVDVIATLGAVSAQAARKTTTKTPIVVGAVVDLVAMGFANSPERPGGNVTGISSFDPQQPRKQFELLKQAIPNLSRVAILSDQDIPRAQSDGGWNPFEKDYDSAARGLNLTPQWLRVKGPEPDLEGAFKSVIDAGAQALVVLEVPVTLRSMRQIADLATKHRVPTLFPGGTSGAGGLFTYGTTIADTVPRVPVFVDKILKGARPEEMPIEVVARSELVVNLKTAREIGLTIPSAVLQRTDKVIE